MIWLVALGGTGALGWLISDLVSPGGGVLLSRVQSIAVPPIGGPFSLIDDSGKPRTDADFHDRFMLVYFGYTHCPDACPTALQDIADALAKLGPAANQIVPIFITIDPDRDTVRYLKGYAEQFDPRFVALTGPDDQVAAAAKAYSVYYRKADDKPDYLMEHTSIVYLMGRDGKFLTQFSHETTPDQMAATLSKYLR
ncbi:MAG TPA: SCO family protein [Candidatus Sulfotelmatobacter sp.]|nr:SCO family protein [Candidatus Sulfotelmatobacter sp.]